MLFEPFTIKNVTFANRVLRSSMGGRTSYYDGTVTPAWKNFERRFAKGGVAGIISATISVHGRRMSPLQYPSLHHDRYIGPLRDGVKAVQSLGSRYIIQLGDPGGHTHLSLLPEEADGKSASAGFDFSYGYRNRTTAMTEEEIEESIQNFGDAARRVREIGCDGIEITASKGYLIHQFLNPATNRRTDAWGGLFEKRFHFLERIMQAVRKSVGADFLCGVRLSAKDYNYLPINVRWPPVFPLRHYFMGNSLPETLQYAKKLEALGTDFLHIDSGFGFPNPMGNTGPYPLDGFILFVNAASHLSAKAKLRALCFNVMPRFLTRAVLGFGWKFRPGANAEFAHEVRRAVRIPIIANGGFQAQDLMESTLRDGKCDMIAVARPLLANPNLLQLFKQGRNMPDRPCSFCSLCCAKTAVLPLGCYDVRRFSSQDEMAAEILRWSASPEEVPEEVASL